MTSADRNPARVYEGLQVKPIINAAGSVTRFGGTKTRPEVLEAMADAASVLVDMRELIRKAGEAVARLTHAAARTQPRAPRTTPDQHDETPQRKTILVVDDSITTRTLEKNILEAVGYEVKLATDGEEALGLLVSDGLPDELDERRAGDRARQRLTPHVEQQRVPRRQVDGL